MHSISDEQRAVIESSGSLRIDACAGAGKTTVLVEYAKQRPKQRILYLAYNRSVRISAQKRFSRSQCPHVRAATVHGMAYQALGIGTRYQLTESGNYTTADILAICGIPTFPDHRELIFAHHVRQLLHLFFNTSTQNVYDTPYLTLSMPSDSRLFVRRNGSALYDFADVLWREVREGRAPMSHDAYLKIYLFTQPRLPYDLILLDEAQDSNPITLELVTRQPADLVAVGDTHQSIYSFRHAVNALESLPYPAMRLSRSWRFGHSIAASAVQALQMKQPLGTYPDGLELKGCRTSPDILASHAVLARSNIRLLRAALDHLDAGVETLHFEGGFKSYTYVQQGPSLYDLLALQRGQLGRIKNPLYRAFDSLSALSEYSRQAGDHETQQLIDLVCAYGARLPACLKELRRREVQDATQADVSFSTIHKAKGAEYGTCELTEDFVDMRTVQDFCINHVRERPLSRSGVPLTRAALTEEVNILYTAITRPQGSIDIPRAIFELSPIPHAPERKVAHG